MSKLKILLISWGAYPLRSGSSILVNNLASQFTKEELIIVAEKPIDPDTNGWNPKWPAIHYLGREISWPRRGKKFFRWIKWLYLPYYFLKLRSLSKKEGIDRIVVIFPDEYYFFLSYLISVSLKIPIYPWLHNTYLENRSGIAYLFAKWLQAKVFKRAKKILVLSEGMKRYYNNAYNNIFPETLLHGFPMSHLKDELKTEERKEKIKFLFLGNFNHACIDASKRLILSIISNPSYEVHICSPTPQWVFEREGLKTRNIIYHGFVEELGEELNQYDIMLLPHGFEGGLSDIEYKTIFPTRTIFLLTSNKPILAHCPENCFLTDFLLEKQCAKVVTSKNQQSILNAIDELLSNKKESQKLINNALEASRMFDVQYTAQKLRTILSEE